VLTKLGTLPLPHANPLSPVPLLMQSRPLTSTKTISPLGSERIIMIKSKYFGWEFKPALTAAIHKIASDLGLGTVKVTFRADIPTAAINRQGQIYITNIADDAVLTRQDLERFTGFALHELLHRHRSGQLLAPTA
jgi:hypothetical protein